MKFVKGFLTLKNLIINTSSQDAEYGELSDIAYTYSKEKGFYNSGSYDTFELVAFSLKDSNYLDTTLVQSEIDRVFAACQDIITSVNTITDKDDIESMITYALARNNTISNIIFDSVTSYAGKYYPNYIEFNLNDVSCSLWLNKDLFEVEFDEYTIGVVPPVDNLDFLTGASNLVIEALNNINSKDMLDRIIVYRGNEPETVIRVFNYPYVNPNNQSQEINCYWGFIINGIAGDFEDLCQDALEDYIRHNSDVDIDVWQRLFPSIFRRNEFIVIPSWDTFAIPDMLTLTGIYSQIVDNAIINKDLSRYVPFYTQTHVRNQRMYVPHPYKFSRLTVVNGEHTLATIRDFKEQYSDYIPVTSTSYEFSRMSTKSQRLMTALDSLLKTCDEYRPRTVISLPIKLRRKMGVLYLSMKVNEHLILMIPKTEYFRL